MVGDESNSSGRELCLETRAMLVDKSDSSRRYLEMRAILQDDSDSSRREQCYDVRKEARVKKRYLLEVMLDAKSELVGSTICKRSCHESSCNVFRIYFVQIDGRCQIAESKMTLARSSNT